MNFILHKDFAEISPSSWNALAEQSIADTPFSRHEYLSEWWKTLGGGEWKSAELVLISARENDELIGIAPLFLADYEGHRALMLLGSIEISDYLDLIVRKEDLPRFVSGLFDFLLSTIAGPAWTGITSPTTLPPSQRSKPKPGNAAGLITRRSIAPPRASH